MEEKKENYRRGFIKKGVIAGISAISLNSVGWANTRALSAEDGRSKKYSLLPSGNDPKNFTILFQGDSITDGNRTRNNDWNHVMGHGYAYLIASRLWYDHPDKGLLFFNRGISGNKVKDLAARWQQDTLDIKPDLLSILVGVNDADSMFTKDNPERVPATEYEEAYRELLKVTKTQLPAARIVLCEPFILPVGKVKDNWDAWSVDIKTRQQIVRRLALELGAVYIELQDAFNEACNKAPADYWIWDGIHPMPAGHELIARQWIKTVSKKLPLIL